MNFMNKTMHNNIRQCALLAITFLLLPASMLGATKVFEVKPTNSDATRALQLAIDKAAAWTATHEGGATVKLRPGVYNISRKASTARLYHVSNTTSKEENPDPTKHIGMLFKNARDITFDGNGAKIVTHGEMTPWAIDSCVNITLKNFAIDAADPSVPEMTVEEADESGFTAKVHPRSTYEIKDGKLWWTGEGWNFTNGIAQAFSPEDSTTLRCGSPVVEAAKVEETAPGHLRFLYEKPCKVKEGTVFQMRHSLRTEVAGLINWSREVTLDNVQLHFLGNFGVVAQMSQNIAYHKVTCAPDPESGRTCAGFADFMQISGCKGTLKIDSCYFAGAHDDPINVHGTHLAVDRWISPHRAVVSYRHPQTFGFQSFVPGDTVEIVDSRTLLANATAIVAEAKMVDPYHIELTFTNDIDESLRAKTNLVVENVSWCPEVSITDNYFTLTPTRGILITTRGKSTIARNKFVRIPMASILVADDARSWFESGPVHNLTIADNRFIDCSETTIWVAPENIPASSTDAKVHRNISITGNSFEFSGKRTPFGAPRSRIKARSVDGLYVSNPGNTPGSVVVELDDCLNVSVNPTD